MAEGFLGRWSQRKGDARQGKPLVEPEVLVTPPTAPGVPAPVPAPVSAEPSGMADTKPETPVPTLQDVQALGRDSDYTPFVARGVDPAVRNAALKKLFTDPHYNVMDRLDTYIDDYSQPDPLPASMLRQMASAQFLKLLDDEETPPPAAAPQPASQDHHADTDLRLQQDHAPGSEGTGDGTQ
ncbi:MAG: DUF3306 domain-containing protein [Burkholderiales bacterium]|nr:DUF3306 domain-containing protein [Burkholderiales bacterium]